MRAASGVVAIDLRPEAAGTKNVTDWSNGIHHAVRVLADPVDTPRPSGMATVAMPVSL